MEARNEARCEWEGGPLQKLQGLESHALFAGVGRGGGVVEGAGVRFPSMTICRWQLLTSKVVSLKEADLDCCQSQGSILNLSVPFFAILFL